MQSTNLNKVYLISLGQIDEYDSSDYDIVGFFSGPADFDFTELQSLIKLNRYEQSRYNDEQLLAKDRLYTEAYEGFREECNAASLFIPNFNYSEKLKLKRPRTELWLANFKKWQQENLPPKASKDVICKYLLAHGFILVEYKEVNFYAY